MCNNWTLLRLIRQHHESAGDNTEVSDIQSPKWRESGSTSWTRGSPWCTHDSAVFWLWRQVSRHSRCTLYTLPLRRNDNSGTWKQINAKFNSPARRTCCACIRTALCSAICFRPDLVPMASLAIARNLLLPSSVHRDKVARQARLARSHYQMTHLNRTGWCRTLPYLVVMHKHQRSVHMRDWHVSTRSWKEGTKKKCCFGVWFLKKVLKFSQWIAHGLEIVAVSTKEFPPKTCWNFVYRYVVFFRTFQPWHKCLQCQTKQGDHNTLFHEVKAYSRQGHN